MKRFPARRRADSGREGGLRNGSLTGAGVQTDLQAILDATMDIVCVFDSERRFVTVNAAACRFHNATREELIGHKLDEFIGKERAEADWKDFLTPERIAQGMQQNVWEAEQDG